MHSNSNEKLNSIVLEVLNELIKKEQFTEKISLDITVVLKAIGRKIEKNLQDISNSLEYCYECYRNNRWNVVVENNLINFYPCGNKVIRNKKQ